MNRRRLWGQALGGVAVAAGLVAAGIWGWNAAHAPLPPPKVRSPEQMLVQLQDAAQKHPSDPNALITLGNAYFDLGRYPLAVATYRQALSLEPHLADVRVDMGTALLYQGKVPDAIDAYKAAIADEPNHVNAHFNLGVAYRNANQRDKALQEWATAERLTDDPKVKAKIEGVKAAFLKAEAASASHKP